MRTIVCFGDSNTWGHIPGDTEARFPFAKRWPGHLERLLGEGFRIVEEGLNGRTASSDDPIWPDRNGRSHLPIVLETHSPIDLLIIMLGTNDIKARLNNSPFTIAQGMEALGALAQNSGSRVHKLLLVAPPHIVETTMFDTVMAYEGSLDKSRELAGHYSRVAQRLGCNFIDTADWIESSAIDGIHLDESAHAQMGSKLCEVVRGIFEKET